MGPLNPLAALFGSSPIKPIQDHMSVVSQATAELPAFFDAAFKEDWDAAERAQQQISQYEHDADAKKKEIRLHLPKSLFLPVPRSDLLELLSVQDSIANGAKDIAGIMLGRKMVVPSVLRKELKAFLMTSIATAKQALKAINELDELLETGFSGGYEVALVEKMITELDRLENRSDQQEIAIRASLFAIESEMPPIEVMFLYNIIDDIGELANGSQKVGSRLQLLLAR